MTPAERQALREVTGRIYATETFGTVDGPGVRFVLFLQGCPLRCLYCHNPDSVPCGGGEEWTAGKAADEIGRYRSFLRRGGVTLSGGEPLAQPGFALAVMRLLHEEDVHVAVDTAGAELTEQVRAAVDEADLLLLDIKAADNDTATRLTGRDTKPAWALLDYCEAKGKPVWIRHVLLRGWTLDMQALDGLAERLSGYRCIERVELLPFHKLGEPKWEMLGRPYQLGDVEATTAEEKQAAAELFERRGMKVQ